MSDLRALLIRILGGIIAYYATRGIDRYLSRRTIRSRRRQIKQLTQELHLLEKLGVTDRTLLLFAFTMLFVVIAFAAVGIGGWVVLSLPSGQPDIPTRLLLLVVPFVIAVVAVYAASVFRKLEDPPPTLARLRQELGELQGMDDQSPLDNLALALVMPTGGCFLPSQVV